MSPLRAAALVLSLLLALAAAWVFASPVRAIWGHVAPTAIRATTAAEFEQLYATGPARMRPRAPAPADPLREGPRARAELLPELNTRELTLLFGPVDAGELVLDPVRYFERRANLEHEQYLAEHPRKRFVMRTDALGLRRDGEVAAERPALRVLVSGDSHVEGVVPNRQNLCAALERRLVLEGVVPTAEVLDAGTGGTTFLNYLATLERYADLRPHVFVSVVYGGNDFYAQCVLEHYLRGLPVQKRLSEAVRAVMEEGPSMTGVLAQDLVQALHFVANPEDEQLAVDSALEYELAMRARAQELGASFVCVYLPPASAVQYERFAELYDRGLELARQPRSVLAVSERIAERMLAGLRQAGVRCVDLRPSLRAAQQPCYWREDLHLSVAGHSQAAAALYPTLVELARLGTPAATAVEASASLERK